MAKWLWGYSSRQAAANAAYTFADDKPTYLQVEPPRSCTTRIADGVTAVRTAVSDARTAVSAALANLLCFRSYWWSIPLAVASLGLSIAWFVMILIIDADTIYSQYGFEPLPTGAYNKWGLAMYIIVPALWIPMLATTCMEARRPARWIMYFVSTVFAIMLVIGNALSVTRTHDRRAIEQDFVAQFNTLYCNARIVRACLDNKQPDVLVLTGIGNASALNSSPNTTAGALAVFTHCSDAILTNMGRDTQSIVDDPIAYISVEWINQLLADSDAPRDLDAWCGHRAAQVQMGTQLTAAEQRAPASPFASNTDMFQRYIHEWPHRMLYANALLGPAVGCMLLAAVSYTLKANTEGYHPGRCTSRK